LPEGVKPEEVQAVYENGVLKVTLPKKEVAKVEDARVIEIV